MRDGLCADAMLEIIYKMLLDFFSGFTAILECNDAF